MTLAPLPIAAAAAGVSTGVLLLVDLLVCLALLGLAYVAFGRRS